LAEQNKTIAVSANTIRRIVINRLLKLPFVSRTRKRRNPQPVTCLHVRLTSYA
jgi:hypothetical protein